MHWIIYPLYLVLVLYWAVSACFAGTRGFWPLFWTGYVEMTFVSISDFLILDCWLPPKAKAFDIIALDYILITKTHFFQHYIPETKGCAGYHSFGYNRKEQLTRILTLIWIAGAAIVAGIIVLLF